MGVLVEILKTIAERGPISPGDVVSLLGAPRYRVLAAFHCLEELGLVDKVYSKGNHKVYVVSYTGRVILDRLHEGGSLGDVIADVMISSTGAEAEEATA